jgi:hypothetical protein
MFKKLLAPLLCLLTVASVMTAVAHQSAARAAAYDTQNAAVYRYDAQMSVIPTMSTIPTTTSTTSKSSGLGVISGGGSVFGDIINAVWPTISSFWQQFLPAVSLILSQIVAWVVNAVFGTNHKVF